MSKLGAIYSALDAGNPKSALKLCQQVLSKSNSQIVRALMALSHSRLDQSEESTEICQAIENEGVSDTTVIETLCYVYRREHRFDLLSALISKTVSESDRDLMRQGFIAGVQSGRYESLSSLAAKLNKLSGDKNYYAWAAFAMELKDEKNIPLALAMLDKALACSLPNPDGESRTSTSARSHAYLSLYKLQLLGLVGKWEEARQTVNLIKSGLVSEREKQQLLDDIALFSGETTYLPIETVDSSIGRLESLVMRDAKLIGTGNLSAWNSDVNYQEFLKCLEHHIETSVPRSDCVVTSAPFLSLVQQCSVEALKQFLLKIDTASHIAYLNVQKLLYGIDKKAVSSGSLIYRALTCMQSETDTDECSPGKQLLLLAALVLLENGNEASCLVDAITLLDYGSKRFSHCSHFRLIQAVLYTRLGLMSRGIERFQAMGIKNSQWRNLFWIISGPLLRFYTQERADLLTEIESFFKRNKSELHYAMDSVVKENMFFKHRDFLDELAQSETSWVRTHARQQLEFTNLLESTQLSVSPSQCLDRSESDYSPLLFITLPAVGSKKTQYFNESVQGKRMFTSRSCGLKWPRSITVHHVPRVTKEIPISPSRSVGRLIQPFGEEAEPWLTQQYSLMIRVAGILSGNLESKIEASNRTDMHILIDLIATADLDDKYEEITERIKSMFEYIDVSDWQQALIGFGSLLNGNLKGVLVVLEHMGSNYSKKSAERKIVKQIMALIRTESAALIAKLIDIKIACGDVSSLPDFFTEIARAEAVARLHADLQMDLKGIRTELEAIIDRVKLSKL